jgi:hypothetical protein
MTVPRKDALEEAHSIAQELYAYCQLHDISIVGSCEAEEDNLVIFGRSTTKFFMAQHILLVLESLPDYEFDLVEEAVKKYSRDRYPGYFRRLFNAIIGR